MSGKKQNQEFECPICGSKKYHTKAIGQIKMGGKNPISHYYCDICSVVFHDPKKFSKKSKS